MLPFVSCTNLSLTAKEVRMTHRPGNAFCHPSAWQKEGGAGERTHKPPEHRLRGGDTLHGCNPLGSGHAGRQTLARSCIRILPCSVVVAFALVVIHAFGVVLPNSRAYATQQLRFQNGGTAQQNDDGTVTGRCMVTAIWHGLDTSYEFTMPDGQKLEAHCVDYGYVNPADDEYDFTAQPMGDGSYHIYAHTDRAIYYQSFEEPRILANGALIQRTESDGTWMPQVVRTGMVRIKKTSANPSLTNGLATYTLRGATFSIWRDAACTQQVDGVTLTSDEEGMTKPANLDEGTYWAKEDAPPSGFAVSGSPQPFTIVSGETSTVTFVDQALYERIELVAQKADVESGVAQGSGTLEGAEFSVRYYDGTYTLQNLPSQPKRSWTLRSNERGEVLLSASARVGSTAFYADENGNPVLPIGTIVVQETKAPQGYYLEGQTGSSPAGYEAPMHLMRSTGHQSYAAPRIEERVQRAGIAVQKHDAETDGTAQGDATLSGIGFAIYNANSTNVVVDGAVYAPGAAIGGSLVTDDRGVAQTSSDYLPLGTYEVREVSTNESMRNTSQVQRVTLVASQTSTCVRCGQPFKDSVVRGGLRIVKHDADLQSGQSQGDATLAGAEFSIVLDSANPVRVGNKTYNKGQTVMTITTDDAGAAQTGVSDLPYGTYIVREVRGPQGYHRNTAYEERVSIRAESRLVDLEERSCDESVIRGGVRLGKIDRDLQTQCAQGDATLSGAEFSVYLQSDQPVVVGDTTYTQGQVVATMTTDEQGVATTGDRDLPYATYSIRETVPPKGYLLNEEFERQFSIREEGVVQNLGSAACSDSIIRAGVAVGKVSRETSKHLNQGEAKVKGAVFSVTLKSPESVVVAGTLYEPESVVCTLTTDENGYAATDEHLLPYGTYEVREVEPPAGFLPNEDWIQTFEVREDGVIYDKSGEAESADDQVMRGGFGFNKVDEPTMERMGGIPFRITSLTTGETHVVLTDENGLFHTETNAHTHKTNANDGAVDEHDVLLPEKAELDAGVWFSGLADVATEASDEMGALPYDTYEVRELRAPANESRELVAFTLRIHAHEYMADMGTVDNKTPTQEEPRIGTTLTYDDTSHMAPATDRVMLVDTVRYEGLKPNVAYELRGELRDKETGDTISASNTSFTATTSAGKVELSFELDAREMAGRTVVAFECLSADGEDVAWHEDMDDEDQCVHFPSVGTSCADAEGNHEISSADERVRLVDTVEYHNVAPNKSYEMVGTLYDKTHGTKLVDDDGRELSSVVSFVPETSDGTVEVVFLLKPSMVKGITLVAFEELRRTGMMVAQHADVEDEGQTVTIPDIATQLSDEQGHHTIGEGQTITLVDTVTFTNLTPGLTYEIHGVLMDKGTGEPIRDAQGVAVEVNAAFVPSVESGTTNVSFVVDRSLVEEKLVVAFETLKREGRELVVHADIEDNAQTVGIPHVGTQLTDEKGSHEVEPTETLNLTDTVAYGGVMPGEAYMIVGKLVDKDTGEPMHHEDGSELVATREFEASGSSGTVELAFTLNATALEGKSIVAFEQLLQGGEEDRRIVARHEDLTDANQTVLIKKVNPEEKHPTEEPQEKEEPKEKEPEVVKPEEGKPNEKKTEEQKSDVTQSGQKASASTQRNEPEPSGSSAQKSNTSTGGAAATPRTGDATVTPLACAFAGLLVLACARILKR